MKIKTLIILVPLFFFTSCQTQQASPTNMPTVLPTETPLPTETATLAPTETPLPTPTPSDIFGGIPLNSVQAFSLEPIAKAIFENAMQGYVNAGSVQEYRVDSLTVFPAGNGTLLAEIYYSVRSNDALWLEDGGTQEADGWITGKCNRFDLIATESEHQLKNKRLCS
jgi:hypothetical protein